MSAVLPSFFPPRVRVAILGGGFTGAAVAYHLARSLPGKRAEIIVVEPRERLGAGLAYSTQEPAHRINVPAARMSLDTNEPDQFARWLADNGLPQDDPAAFDPRGVFPQRSLFGRYVASMLAPFVADGRVRHVRQRAEAVVRRGEDGYLIRLSDGSALPADLVVLATTHPLPAVPRSLAPIAASPAFFGDPYDPAALRGVAPDARVLIVGNGLTAADVVATLDRLGHRAPITCLSRNGLRSRGHAQAATEPVGDFERAPAQNALGLLRRVRSTLASSAAGGSSWHATLDAVRQQGGSIWQALSDHERRRLVRHLRSFWDVHRFRIAPQVEAVLDRRIAEGRLQNIAASILAAEARGDGTAAVTFRHRRSGTIVTEVFDVIVNTTGPAHRSVTEREPARSLAVAGLVVPDATGLGLASARNGRALDREGRPVPGLFIAGPLARGTFGELMGLPEVTRHAEFIAGELASALATLPVRIPA